LEYVGLRNPFDWVQRVVRGWSEGEGDFACKNDELLNASSCQNQRRNLMKTHYSPQTFRRYIFVPILLCTLVLLTAPVWAATLHVPKKHKTIQSAVDAAKDGDTVLVAPGTPSSEAGYQP
jgi:hypothetical protein